MFTPIKTTKAVAKPKPVPKKYGTQTPNHDKIKQLY